MRLNMRTRLVTSASLSINQSSRRGSGQSGRAKPRGPGYALETLDFFGGRIRFAYGPPPSSRGPTGQDTLGQGKVAH